MSISSHRFPSAEQSAHWARWECVVKFLWKGIWWKTLCNCCPGPHGISAAMTATHSYHCFLLLLAGSLQNGSVWEPCSAGHSGPVSCASAQDYIEKSPSVGLSGWIDFSQLGRKTHAGKSSCTYLVPTTKWPVDLAVLPCQQLLPWRWTFAHPGGSGSTFVESCMDLPPASRDRLHAWGCLVCWEVSLQHSMEAHYPDSLQYVGNHFGVLKSPAGEAVWKMTVSLLLFGDPARSH